MVNSDDGEITKTIPLYSSYTYNSKNLLVRYPHRKRNNLVSETIEKISPEAWLDYGAGDGALVEKLNARNSLPGAVVLYEPDEGMREQLTQNIKKIRENIVVVSDKNQISPLKYDLITALEVLEHLPLQQRIEFYIFVAETIKPSGKCLIEVPVEYGPILLIKELGRKFIKRRVSEYSINELFRAFIGKIQDTKNRYDITDNRTFISPHRGFDLNKFLTELGAIGTYRELVRSPFTFLPRMFNQVVLYEYKLSVFDKHDIINKIVCLY